jgi:surfeit locus 1 family protein
LPPYTQVSVHARADNQRVLLLDNKIHGGRFGYQVVQLVQTPLANVLINRGWVPGSHDRSERPRIETLAPEQRYMGRIGVLSQHPMLNTTPLDDDYPKRFNQLSLPAVGHHLGVSVSQIIELAPESYGALTVNWPKVNVSPAKHIGYAVQWFCMSLALLVLLFFANSNLSALLKARANNNQQKM